MQFLDLIFSLVWDLAWWFRDRVNDAEGLPFVGGWLADLCYQIFRALYKVAQAIANFYYWLYDLTQTIAGLADPSTLRDLIISWFPGLGDLIEWFSNWYLTVRDVINMWWQTAQVHVKAWIDIATEGIRTLVDQLANQVISLESQISELLARLPSLEELLLWWGNWWGNVIGAVISWGALTGSQIQGLINSAFTIREGLWAGWQEIRDQVFEFFANPLDWLASRIETWFWGEKE